MIKLRRLLASDVDFDSQLQQLLAWDQQSHDAVEITVNDILQQVREKGDAAVLLYTQKFDRVQAGTIAALTLNQAELQKALASVGEEQRGALEQAAERIRAFHQKQQQASWTFEDPLGNTLGQQVTPLDRVGIYVPGGKASYPSSVLMNAIPAQVAGVQQISMVVPTPDGEINDMVLAAAAVAGVDQVFTIGGAQAIAALTYGTESIPAVDKIVGPGNIYVATAKQKVFGQVGIDMIAGPSEILVFSDGNSDPDWIAMDLFSQAEHDELAQSILISTDDAFLDKVESSINKLIEQQDRRSTITTSLENRGALIQVDSVQRAIDLINRVAPEHLELAVDDPEQLLPQIRHAGAIFMGRHTPEALGDYCAGPNHVLPTSGTARFASPLGVYDFQKRSSIIHCTPQGASELSAIASTLARAEGLTAHAESAEYRRIDAD